jgi:eukaryotic-like serine/threonine-protein kinase
MSVRDVLAQPKPTMINTPRSIGNYLLEHELGRGATAQVWRGRHRMLTERAVAVKILLSQDEETVARFTREADMISRLRHPNIVAVYDHGTAGTFMYTIMELVLGGSLRQFMEKHGRVELKDAVNIFRQIGAALDYSHEQQIVHRDVSPGNILLEAGPGGRVVLTDFGIARLPQQSHTTMQVIMGTPGFFSPEHAQSATAVTALSDLYSLGVILYFMLTGALPWEKQPEHPDYHFGPVLPLAAHGLDLPPDVDRVFQTLLALDPRKRYPSAEAATEALDRALVRAGIMLNPKQPALADLATVRAINTSPTFQSFGVMDSEVEQVLGADLLRDPIEKAHARAEALRDPINLGKLLDQWSIEGKRTEFRKQHLGRIVNLRDIRSQNVYFYQLEVLLETREQPTTMEEPDRDMHAFPVQREQDRWNVKLPRPNGFADDPGRTEILTGSERVMQCGRCEGNGHELCPTCKGSRRVLQTRTVPAGQNGGQVAMINQQDTINARAGEGAATAVAAPPAAAGQYEVRQALVPCPTCNGGGSLQCTQCQGIGRLVQRKVFNWQRVAWQRKSHDDLPNLNERALRDETTMETVYEEATTGFKREWRAVPGLRSLINEAERETGPDTRPVMTKVTVRMIPLTFVQFDLGHQQVTVEGERASVASRDDTIYTMQVAGFENKLIVGPWAYDSGRRTLIYVFVALIIAFILYTIYVFAVI